MPHTVWAMRSADIRRTFQQFFERRDHRVWPSASLIPNDPSLLLTVAGMVPFKPYFLGQVTPEHPRATSDQKCMRTVDIENVGLTARHLTFFEMLGNFSFGDYFKADAIRWAWQLSVTPQAEGGFGFDPDRVWATVYETDDEAADLWLAETDLPAARLQRRGASDNYWSTGGPGPCGPCSELFYDRGPDHGAAGGPVVDEARYIEFWNLVFMQYETRGQGDPDLKGSDDIVGELPDKNVDTGMGLERMAVLLQDVPNVYETDVLRPLLDLASDLVGVGYGSGDGGADVSLRVVAEHCRAAAMLIADGVLPSNESRGYVLRRMLRRVVRHARQLGHDGPMMDPMMQQVIATLGDAWPELRGQSALVRRIAQSEETSFSATLRTGLRMLDETVGQLKERGESALSGQTAFVLHDTYGFPIDLTLEIAAEHGLDLDRDEFARLMEGQRTRAREHARGRGGGDGVDAGTYRQAGDRVGASVFTGYADREAETSLGALVAPGGLLDSAEEGEDIEVVLARTPFYAEGGGQLGDHGLITTDTGRIQVTDTVSPLEGLIVHRGHVVAGEVRTGQQAHAAIDVARRASITRGHTATHLLHVTIRQVLGEHAAQAGSAIDAGRFRFDFPHFSPVGPDQLAEVERRVNERIGGDEAVETIETSQREAREMGATALFGEKYGERVRVVRIGADSVELCGGTHVGHSAEVGLFTVLTEGSIAANTRRIEATTGVDAFRFLSAQRLIAEEAARALKVPPDELAQRVGALAERVRELEKELGRQRQQAVLAQAESMLADAEAVGDARVLAVAVAGADRDGLRSLAADLRNRLGSGVVLLGSRSDEGAALLVAAVSADLAGRGITARDVLQSGARAVGGGAGGKGDIAVAGGRDGGRLDEALDIARREARERLQTTA